jgi:F420-dependent oxidoreductase-like protein
MHDEFSISRRHLLKGLGVVAAATVARPAHGLDVTPGAVPGTPAPLPTGPVKFGVTFTQGGSFDQILTLWEGAEALGFDSAFVFDHFMGMMPGTPESERHQEAWTLLAALAARTRKIRLGVLVNCSTYRHPAIVAKMAATVDQISGGRLILGLGAGWSEREHNAYGIPFYTKAVRARRLGEFVEVIVRLFTQERTTYAGKYFTLTDAPLEPKPVQRPHPPILIGGSGPKLVQPIAARYAQIWHFGVPNQDIEELKRMGAAFDALCRSVGRDPAEVVKATSLGVPKDSQGLKDLRTTLSQMVAAGIRYLILLPPPDNNLELLRRFAQEVIPEFRH